MKGELFKRILRSLILIPICFFAILDGYYIFNLFLFIFFCIATYEWRNMSKNKNYYFFGLIFLIFSFTTVYQIRTSIHEGYYYLLFVILTCIFSDIGGYVFGKTFRGPKLTNYSPNKTISGAIGSFLISILSLFLIKDYFFSEMSNFSYFLLIFLISSTCQIGDIIISYFKRQSNIKDTGKIIPGHGGILDRIDGMIFACPSFYIIYLIVF